ncbi:MAG: 1,4-alpha-glucan branching protein GlgB [Thermoprotei archaeon]
MDQIELSQEQVSSVVNFNCDRPEKVLGLHVLGDKFSFRAYLPLAESAWIRGGKDVVLPLKKIHAGGFYVAEGEKSDFPPSYTVCFKDSSGYIHECEDPYSFGTEITDFELYLWGKGELEDSFDTFGAHLEERAGVKGVRFALWAPNARAVCVIGNFNHWVIGSHPMARRQGGVWELFVPRIREDEVYKFAVKCADGVVRQKADPYAFRSELRPHTASVVCGLTGYEWGDHEWMELRKRWDMFSQPISIYEVHLGSWLEKRGDDYPSYVKLSEYLSDYVKHLGFTHVELLPVMEHPLDASWGYEVSGYYSPTSRYGSPKDFMTFVDTLHRKGVGVILDWVPGHFPKDDWSLGNFDGTHLYEPEDELRREHPDWNTYVFDYSKNQVKNYLISNAIFWLEKYHVDGLRVDAVASMLYLDYSRPHGKWRPNKFGGKENLEAIEFIQTLNKIVHRRFPGAMVIAEESTAWPNVTKPVYAGGLGFDFKWNMGWMHDTLAYFSTDPLYRKYEHGRLTFSLWYAFSENYVLPFSHDEVVHGKRSLLEKMPGDDWQKFANLRLCYAYMFGHPGKKLLFMGSEFAQRREWSEKLGLDWYLLDDPRHRGVQILLRDLNSLYVSRKELYEREVDSSCFEWVDFRDVEQSVISFLRWSKNRESFILFVLNMTPIPRYYYRVGVPKRGFYKELLNTDAREYGGSGVGNYGGVNSEDIPFHGRPYSLSLTLPPLGALILECVGSEKMNMNPKTATKNPLFRLKPHIEACVQ